MSENILDKIIQADVDEKKAELNPQELVGFLLKDLNSREKEIIRARYGLDQVEKQTLEAIGKRFDITRERVRQIENNGLKKALATREKTEKLEFLLSLVLKILNNAGYMALEDKILDELTENNIEPEVDKNCLRFIFSKFLDSHIEPVQIVQTEKAWRIKNKELAHYEPLVEGIKNVLRVKNEPLPLKEILGALEGKLDERVKQLQNEIIDWEKAVCSYLEVSKHFKKNLFDKWGLAHWRTVNPKRMRDKIHLILQKYEKPLHYKQIVEHINQEQFDAKRAHPATVHNELILDERYVLIGRGIYALAEWGYKPGVIAEVIRDILQEGGTALTKGDIMKEVLKRRMVKEGSVNLILSNKELFEKLSDGRYKVKA